MQVSVETTSGLERRVTVGVPAEKVDVAVEGKLQEAQKTIRLDGFRPGKVPMREVKRRFGGAVRNEVLADVMREAFIEAVEQEKLQPAGMPGFEATTNEAGKDLEFVATFEVYPQVELAAFDSIEVEKPQSEVTDADVDTMIETLRQQRAEFADVDRASEIGDRVNIDFKGLKDGEAFEGGTAEGQNLELGSGQMIPGFEDGIVGMKAGEEKDIDVTFPEDYQSEDLKGQAVVFHIKVNKVEGKALPEVDAEFMKGFGVDDGDETKFKAEVRKNMERELKNAITSKVKEQAMDGLVNLHEFDLPGALVTQEIQRMRQQMMQQFGGGQQFDPSILPDDLFKEQAERSVRLGLVVRAILDKNEIKADADKVKARVEEISEQYEKPEEVVSWVYSNPQQLQQIEGAILEEQVVDQLLAAAKVSDVEVSYEDAIKPEQPAPAEETEEAAE
jgi:trigger factor